MSYSTAPLRRAALPALTNLSSKRYASAAAAEPVVEITNPDLLTVEEIIERMSPQESARLGQLRNIGIAVCGSLSYHSRGY